MVFTAENQQKASGLSKLCPPLKTTKRKHNNRTIREDPIGTVLTTNESRDSSSLQK